MHATSGSDFGYRNGAGKWPPYYIDSLPPVANVGPGSPTGVVFGYGAKFPPKYQEALYLCDWSYGKLYALHFDPRGASYTGELEEFVAGTPLALTDVVVNPKDGAMYFLVGGRKTQSGLYRVTYAGEDNQAGGNLEAKAPVEARATRHKLEAFHGRADPQALAVAWPELGNADRFLRWAARVAVEFQDPATWRDKALAESSSPLASLEALLALTQVSAQDPAHRGENDPAPDPKVRDEILAALERLDWQKLDQARQLDLVRVYQVGLNRFPRPDDAAITRLAAKFDQYYPAKGRELNTELAQLLCFFQAPDTARKTIALLGQGASRRKSRSNTPATCAC